ncbi:MAG: hypothetical protein JNN00_06605 [Chitinophagaceae bacterium]|nr:hypothetical protein [Chitinophagaceae bacterium]
MANCNHLFHHYNAAIRLTDDKRQTLIRERDSLRQRMNNGFNMLSYEQKNGHLLEFYSQGSFVMDTIIAPLNDDFDLDDGVYFRGHLNERQRPEPQFFHDLVIKAITAPDDFKKIEDKETCVRVSSKDGFHIDLPIYYAEKNDCPDLAHIISGWILSNPIEFIEWFEIHAKSGFDKAFLYETRLYADKYAKWQEDIRKQDCQLRRIVRYMKAWADLRKGEMPCGIIMTILATENYSEDANDDFAFKNTLIKVRAYLQRNGIRCPRPTTPKGEDLFASTSDTKKQYFMSALNTLIESAEKAIAATNEKSACLEWQKHLGARFPCYLAKDMSMQKEPSDAALKRIAAVSMPWSKNI